jgi:drug/metabolite transporter (DMT)-like permease
VILGTSVVVLHTLASYLEELLFKILNYTFASFMIMFMCIMYVILYVSYLLIRGNKSEKHRFIPRVERAHYPDILLVCLLYVGSVTISKTALNYVSIPLQMVFKSCKLVAIMLSSGLILGKRYSWRDYVIATCFVAGMALYTYGDRQGAAESNKEDVSASDGMLLTGILCLIMALSCDSALGNLQEKVQKKGIICDELELMYIQSAVGIVALFIITAGLDCMSARFFQPAPHARSQVLPVSGTPDPQARVCWFAVNGELVQALALCRQGADPVTFTSFRNMQTLFSLVLVEHMNM